ncbi:MAG: S-methyl-5'-thioadenosine phosphorylase [Burkholderiales bacterium]|nr:S-methyl-5'-thioadenosine phosphorylase [Phycisphaerae bacterium]
MSDIRIGLIGGSGLASAIAGQTHGVIHVIDTPFGAPSAPIIETEWNGLPVYFLSRHGAGHTRNPSQVPYRANIFAMKKLGVTHILASGAVGSLREEYKPRDLVIPDQIIDKTRRQSTFFEAAAVHVEFAEPFCPVLRQILLEAGNGMTVPDGAHRAVHDGGCYVAMEGPAFSTRAESLMHRVWGGDLIGMTAMPEAKLAREAEISYALVALVTDYDCWKHTPATEGSAKPDPQQLLREIIGNLSIASENAVNLLKRAVELIAANPGVADCPAASALKLAIWSDKRQIPQDEVDRLAVLWIQYFRTTEPLPG